jgi:hypothetical protein
LVFISDVLRGRTVLRPWADVLAVPFAALAGSSLLDAMNTV